ncbi:MAG: hypothetical protein EXR69_13510 [Myxococcales bacterium]|nr:hypothetical protein [Myxococcales bacterium]
MMQLPHELRDTVVEQLDEYLESQNGTPDAEAVAAFVIDLLGTAAEELKLPDADDIIVKMETSGELDASLLELLEEHFESSEDLDLTAEDILALIEKVCDVEWTTKDDEDAEDEEEEDDPDGFFDDMGGGDEDEDM